MDLIDHLTEATDKPVMLHLSGTRLDMGELAEEKERLRITNQVFLRDATFDWCNKPPAIDDTRHMRPGVHGACPVRSPSRGSSRRSRPVRRDPMSSSLRGWSAVLYPLTLWTSCVIHALHLIDAQRCCSLPVCFVYFVLPHSRSPRCCHAVCTNDAWLDLAPDREPWVKKFVVFEGVTFTGVAGFRSCLLHVERCSHVVLRRCVFRGSDHDGVFISGGSYVRMEGCTIAGCRGAGVRVDDRSRLDMVDCEVVGNGYGVLAGGAGTTVSVQGKGTLIQLNSKAGVTAGKQAAVFFR